MWSHHSSSHGSATNVYIILITHSLSIELFNAFIFRDLANQEAVLVCIYSVLRFFIHYIKDWENTEAVSSIVRKLSYLWETHVWWRLFDCRATLVLGDCRTARACINACMDVCILVNACAYASMFACMYVCMTHDLWWDLTLTKICPPVPRWW